MKQSKQTRQAFLMSVLAMLLCVTMLVGTTMAWFTDSVTTGVNKIVAGNLDVELYVRNAEGNYVPVDERTSLFDENALWEPGYTQVVYLKVRNAGTLALKYKFSVTGKDTVIGKSVLDDRDIKLSEHLVFGQVESENEIAKFANREAAWEAVAGTKMGLQDFNKESPELLPNAEEYVALVVYMPTTVGNEANYRGTDIPTVELGVTLVATQTPHEEDSFDEKYDEDLPLTWAATAGELNAAIADGGSVMVMDDVDAGSYLGFEIKDDTVINGNGNVLTTSASAVGGTDPRVLDLYQLTNKTLTVSDAVIGGNDEASYPARGISLATNTNPVVNVKNSTVHAKSYAICIAWENTNPELNVSNSTVTAETYAVNISKPVANPKVNFEGSTFEGYAAFQTHSGGVTGTFKNSTFKGVNKWDTTEDSWNNFAVIVVTENATEAGTNLTFDNCTISAEEQKTAKEWFFSLRQSCTLNLNGCTFVKNGETVSTEDVITDIQTGAGEYVQIYPDIDVTIFVDGVQIKPAA